MTEPITCNLAENALDYLLLAGEQAKEGSPRMLKHALATLADGVELLLKARLEMKDWCLVFKDVDQANRQKYEAGDFQSIVFEQAVKRLENICSVQIPNSHLAIINKLRQLRNRIRHFAVSTDNRAANSLIAKTFSFAIEFVTEHLQAVHGELDDELTRLKELLFDYDAFIESRMEEIQSELKEAYCVVRCPVCLQNAFVLGDDDPVCKFCLHKTDGQSAASEWIDRFGRFQSLKDSLIEPQIRGCPNCGIEACVDMNIETDGRRGHVCFVCGEEGRYEQCATCSNFCPRDSLGGMCVDCRQHFASSND